MVMNVIFWRTRACVFPMFIVFAVDAFVADDDRQGNKCLDTLYELCQGLRYFSIGVNRQSNEHLTYRSSWLLLAQRKRRPGA